MTDEDPATNPYAPPAETPPGGPKRKKRRKRDRPCTMEGEIIDSGDFAGLLDTVAPRVLGFAERAAASRARGRLRGLGVAAYIEAILGAADELLSA